jgi:hypothetical protein
MRNSSYSWSDDLGQTWQPLAGIPHCGLENYQPWIHVLADGADRDYKPAMTPQFEFYANSYRGQAQE